MEVAFSFFRDYRRRLSSRPTKRRTFAIREAAPPLPPLRPHRVLDGAAFAVVSVMLSIFVESERLW